jgi:hypothetical protein
MRSKDGSETWSRGYTRDPWMEGALTQGPDHECCGGTHPSGSAVRLVGPGASGWVFQVSKDLGEGARHDLAFLDGQSCAHRAPELSRRLLDRSSDRATPVRQVKVNAASVDGVSTPRDETRGYHVGGHLHHCRSRDPKLPSDFDGGKSIFLVQCPEDVMLSPAASVLLHDLIYGGPGQLRHANEIVPEIGGRHDGPASLLPH